MVRWTADELRQAFIDFFVSKGHAHKPGSSLVPKNDPTILLTSAGMVQFKPYFMGTETPDVRRVTTYQRCLRTGDIENVGSTDRHATFFEMLGNFSFGDYFKEEAIRWAWEFVTERMELPRERLWATIYLDDDEAFQIWHEQIGLPRERIVRLGKEDNFWEIGVGPCGPCSEIHYDRGPQFGCGRDDCRPGCDCERFMEIWNLVFIQFYQDEAGQLTPLEQKGIDTGMGLERAASILQGVGSIFEVDLVRPILDEVARLAGTRYGADPEKDVSLRVITDHLRGIVFLVYDGVLPSNEGRGYVLRRLLRRAALHGRLLGLEGPFLGALVGRVVEQMKAGYPELLAQQEHIRQVIDWEERRFGETLDQGVQLLEEALNRVEAQGTKVLDGEQVFRLYDTYGFPVELTKELAAARGVEVDEAGFQQQMELQRSRARAAREATGYMGKPGVERYAELAREVPPTRFTGYERLEEEAQVLALLVDGQPVVEARAGDQVEIVLDRTPFYAESGGQVPDRGTLTGPGGQVEVEDVQRPVAGVVVHRGRVRSGRIRRDEVVLATVDAHHRWDTARNHTATHLLHQALRDALGQHAHQAGSLVHPEYLRFDFTHFQGLDRGQLRELEEEVNHRILQALPVTTTEMAYEEAIAAGAIALFDEKYGERVRVVAIGEYSKELCGGTHVHSSAQVGPFKIIQEGSVAAGVRRITALTGHGTLKLVTELDEGWDRLARLLGTTRDQVPQQVERLAAQVEELQGKLQKMLDQQATSLADQLLERAERVNGAAVVVASLPGLGKEQLRAMGDRVRERLRSAAVLLGTERDGRVQLVAMATPDLVAKGFHAGRVVQAAAKEVGGGGGGRPDMAEAGGRQPERLEQALAVGKETLKAQLGAAAGLAGDGPTPGEP
nr:alanine--tRNA ligase [Bacillota bacterium]